MAHPRVGNTCIQGYTAYKHTHHAYTTLAPPMNNATKRYATTPRPPVPDGGRSSGGKKYFCTLLKAYFAAPTFFSALARRTP